MKDKKGHAAAKGMSEREGKVWGEGKFANMPTEVEMEIYPKPARPGKADLDDTINGVDRWSAQMEGKRNRYVSDQH